MKSLPTADPASGGSIAWRAARVALALVLLNGALTFANVWPTLGVHWRGELSVEIAALVLLMALVQARRPLLRRGWLALLSVLVVLLALGRYADVTSPALYGRPVNLYWDLPHVGEVIGMLARVASAWQLIGLCLATLVLLGALYLLARWSLAQVDEALRLHRAARLGLGASGALLVACFLAQQLGDGVPRLPRFSIPVSKTYGVQVARVISVLSGSATRTLPPSPVLRSNLAGLHGDDVLLIFVESYGRSTYDRPEFADALRAARAGLLAAIHDTGRDVVSGYVTSPTFGGTSVLAHLSLLTGIQIRDTRRYRLLMTQHRPTLVSVFRTAGYRAIAFMPGNQHPWPEGSFYGFDHIYDAAQLDYRGPQFGWWHIPDQFSLAALDADELQRHPRPPLFVFFPTLSTHMPFRPTPSLQPDWPRMLSAQPYDAAPLRAAMARTPRWTHLGESYVGAVQYFFDSFSSFLRYRPDERAVMILLGDHQPASSVSGEGASWDVPVHVIASRPEILQALRADGFSNGLTPSGPALGDMNQLAFWLLAAFNGPSAADGVAGQPEDVEQERHR
ncbi:MAG TPA: sulfatase-like hydrolase/transferase [Steroidobacteraceae bacterium]|nr:sulfatase-like hydrolase/transferase [Steroidobacteraceae bacterium]